MLEGELPKPLHVVPTTVPRRFRPPNGRTSLRNSGSVGGVRPIVAPLPKLLFGTYPPTTPRSVMPSGHEHYTTGSAPGTSNSVNLPSSRKEQPS